MNTLALLMMTTCTAGADPLPAIDSRYSTVPSYGSYGTSVGADSGQESRPRFFSRLRNFFSRRSQGGNGQYPQASSAYPYGTAAGNNNVGGTVINSGSAPFIGNAPNAASPTFLRPQPASPMPSAPAAKLAPEPF